MSGLLVRVLCVGFSTGGLVGVGDEWVVGRWVGAWGIWEVRGFFRTSCERIQALLA